MLKNLKYELSERKITYRVLADLLNVSEKTAQNKVLGKTEITYEEAHKIRTVLFPQFTFEYLFTEDCSINPQSGIEAAQAEA